MKLLVHPSKGQLVFLARFSTLLRLLFRKTPTVYSENYTYTDSALVGPKSELFSIKTGGTYSYHYDVQGSLNARAFFRPPKPGTCLSVVTTTSCIHCKQDGYPVACVHSEAGFVSGMKWRDQTVLWLGLYILRSEQTAGVLDHTRSAPNSVCLELILTMIFI